MKKFDIIDFLKGYSIFTIVVYHYLHYMHLSDSFDMLISFGGTGVHLFVLLSGFGLYYSYLKNPVSYGFFVRKRLIKVYVPYIIIVLLSAAISIFIPIYTNSLYALGGHVFLYKMFDESIIGSYGYPLWFMSMIIEFYLVFHAIVWIKSKLNQKMFLAFGVLLSIIWSLVVFLIDKENERVWYSFFLQYIWEFAIGMILAEQVFHNQKIMGSKIKQKYLLLIALLNCAIYAFLAIKGGATGKLFNDFAALAGYSLLAVWLYNIKITPLNKLFLHIGKVSMAAYLLHIVILLTISTAFPSMNVVYVVILAAAILFPLSTIYQWSINTFLKLVKL